jgi:hypothetical protein
VIATDAAPPTNQLNVEGLEADPTVAKQDGVTDTPVSWEAWRRYTTAGGEVYQLRRAFFAKVNPFYAPAPNGEVLTELDGVRTVRHESELVKVVQQKDAPDWFECSVEYFLPGHMERHVHRSATVMLKKVPGLFPEQGALPG